MAREAVKKGDNILWVSDNVDNLQGLQEIYARFMELEKNPKVPWILLNICCEGSSDSDYSAAILNLLRNSKKPIKTQVITCAHSYGLVFACVGEERLAWPDATFMHHSFHIGVEHSSLEEMDVLLKNLRKSEKKITDFMREQQGAAGLKALMTEFKKNACKDMYFDAEAAVRYNVVQGIGYFEPVFY